MRGELEAVEPEGGQLGGEKSETLVINGLIGYPLNAVKIQTTQGSEAASCERCDTIIGNFEAVR